MLDAERADGRRILFENDAAIAFVPYFARYAYEVYVAPKATRASVADLGPPPRSADFAEALRHVTVKFDNLWRMPFPYVMTLHQAPTDGGDHRGFHFHVEFHPPAAQARPAQVPRGPRDRRGQLPLGHVAGGQGGRAAGAPRRPLRGAAE